MTLEHDLPGSFDLRVSGGIDSGKEMDRIFNSMIQICLFYRFPPRKKDPVPADAPRAE
jgi:hypothetical protein